MEDEEVAVETKFSAKERVVEPEDIEWLCKAAKIWGNESPKACEKALVRSCCERVKVGAVVTGTAGVNEFVPEDGRAEEEVWSESNMVATLLFVECPGIKIMSHLQHSAEEMFAEKTRGRNQKNNLETASAD